MFSCLKMLELPTFTYCNFRSSGMPPTTLYLSFYIVTAVIVTQKVSLKKITVTVTGLSFHIT